MRFGLAEIHDLEKTCARCCVVLDEGIVVVGMTVLEDRRGLDLSVGSVVCFARGVPALFGWGLDPWTAGGGGIVLSVAESARDRRAA